MVHCLVVDDSEIVRKVARSIIESMGYDVTLADSGQHAVEQCRSRTPDIILLDWQMPGMSGLEFLGALRLSSKAPRPYIVYCLTENDPVEIERAILGGAHDYLLKPFDRVVLGEKLGAIAARTPRALPIGLSASDHHPGTA